LDPYVIILQQLAFISDKSNFSVSLSPGDVPDYEGKLFNPNDLRMLADLIERAKNDKQHIWIEVD